MGVIIGFALHSLAVFAGAKLAKLERVDIWKAAVVALLSYIAIALAGLVLFPLLLIPFIKVLAAAAVMFIGAAVTARLVWEIEWEKACTIGLAVLVIGTVAGWIGLPFGLG